MKYRVTAPVKGVTATVAGVSLVDSVGEVAAADEAAVAYFRRRGYRMEPVADPEPASEAISPAEPETPAEPGKEPGEEPETPADQDNQTDQAEPADPAEPKKTRGRTR